MTHDTALHQLRQRSTEACPLPRIDHPGARSLYIHVPFCFHKCHYCDFYSIVDARDRRAPFVTRLDAELAALSPAAGALRTIFVGGGTPTLLDPEHWAVILDRLHASFSLSTDLEFTVECNPETPTPALLDRLVAGGVNRLSIGAQSFDPRHLKTLERWHDPASVPAALDMARVAGLTNLSLDLIYAIPGQTLDEWRNDLQRALDLEPAHLSCYCLTYEPGTAMTMRRDLGRITPTGDDLATDMQLACLELLQHAGLHRYEVSNFARPGRECRHNLAYWRQDDWLAAGPAASAHVAGARWKNVPHLDNYLNSPDDLTPVIDLETPDARRAVIEKLMTGLRIAEGVDAARILNDARLIDESLPARLTAAAQEAARVGRLTISEDRWRPTDEGFLFADAVAIAFMDAMDG